jgi:hypothetical protein
MALEQIAKAEEELKDFMVYIWTGLDCGTTLLCFKLRLAKRD